MTAFYVAATVVGVMQYARTRERKVLPLIAAFLCFALAYGRELSGPWRDVWHVAGGVCALLTLVMLAPRHGHRNTDEKHRK